VAYRKIVISGDASTEYGGVLFDLDPRSWKERAGRVANRNLKRDEWREYLPDQPYRPTFEHLPLPPEDEL
jgi:hypothetical protein